MISIKPNGVVKEGLLFSQSYRDGIGAEFWRMTRWWADLGKEGPKAWCYGRSCFLMSQTQRWSWRVFKWCVHCACSVAQSRLTLWDPMDCSLPGSSVQGISQARILEWVAISFSRDLPHPGIEPMTPALAGGLFTTEPPGKPQVFSTCALKSCT